MEEKILDLFLFNNKLKFNEIEKSLNVRSNKLVYHIKKLVKRGILEKKGDFYYLTETAENIIPYLSQTRAVLPVVLIHVGDYKKCFLYRREKRPYKEFLSLPGGRIAVGEDIKDAAKRIMKEKHNLSVELKEIHSVSLEHVKKNAKIIHSFLLIFVSATTKDKIDLIDLKTNKKKIIESDYYLLTHKLKSRIEVEKIVSRV